MFSVPNFLLPAECMSIVSLGTQLPWETVSHPASKLYASRDNDRIHWTDPALSKRVWEGTGLAELFATIPVPTGCSRQLKPVGLNTGWRLYCYKPGQHFGPHYDDSVDCPDMPGAVSLYTMLVYLNDDFEGGETNFYKSKGKQFLSVAPVRGMALLHTQGPLCALHEGAEVRSGCKWLLRTDVMYA